ncbi:MAG: hypothetical protein IJ113_08510 [Eggerthellaceae bacterium]|nr:hypothetical protein [Eggerthellaceae bacterium]
MSNAVQQASNVDTSYRQIRIPNNLNFFVIRVMLCSVFAIMLGIGLVSCANDDVKESSISTTSSVSNYSVEAENSVSDVAPGNISVADTADLPVQHIPYGSLMVSDGEYLYLSYRSNDEEKGGLYRIDLNLSHAERIDGGYAQGLCLKGVELYYIDNIGYGIDEPSYRCLDTQTLHASEVSEDSYSQALMEVDPRLAFTAPDDVRHLAVVGNVAYFDEYLGSSEGGSSNENEVPMYDHVLSYRGQMGDNTQTEATWQHRGYSEGLVSAYGDYVFYNRPWAIGARTGSVAADSESGAKPFENMVGDAEVDPDDIEPPAGQRDQDEDAAREEDTPCFYDTKTGETMVLARNYGLTLGLYVVNVNAGYMLVSSYDDAVCDGDSLYLEKLDDPSVSVWVNSLVSGAAQASAFEEREAAEAAAEQEALDNEPYGPGTSALVLSAPDDKQACYRLVRMNGSTEFMILLQPGETVTQSFPSGRYVLKTAEGESWISDEEAFGPSGDYGSTDVYFFEDGGEYSIGGGTHGDFHNEDASGFTG